jgi:hypothetical protein
MTFLDLILCKKKLIVALNERKLDHQISYVLLLAGLFFTAYGRTVRQWRTEGGLGAQTPLPPKFRSFDKAEPNSQFHGKYICNNLIRIRGSLICKLGKTPDKGATAPRLPFSLPSVLN